MRERIVIIYVGKGGGFGTLTGTTATVTVSENLTLFFSPLSFLAEEEDAEELPGCGNPADDGPAIASEEFVLLDRMDAAGSFRRGIRNRSTTSGGCWLNLEDDWNLDGMLPEMSGYWWITVRGALFTLDGFGSGK